MKKSFFLSLALLASGGAQADLSSRATLVGQDFRGAVAGSPVLVCIYSGTSARFEIVSQSGKCAPFIEVR